MALALAALLFAVFVANVAMGALASQPFLGDIGEMLVMFAASIAFVAAILKREADRKAGIDTQQGGNHDT